ncbi:MAG: hypothetical protein FWF44_03995 [Defluviitaleaceae bacterium]|nr:hypothetical protein [Defluviitaleaceae bacterium]
MSFGPTDLQGTVQRSSDIYKAQAVDPRRAETAQQQFAAQFQKQARRQEQTANAASKSENHGAERDGKGKGRGEREKRDDRARQSADTPEEGGMLDVLG